MPRNVLIFHLGGLGDFILTWPLALAAGRLYPQSRIIYVTNSQKGALAEKTLGVESADIEAGWHNLYAHGGELPEKSARLLAGAHLILSFVSAPGDLFSQQAQQRAPAAAFIALQPTPPAAWTSHATEYVLDQLAPQVALHEGLRQILRAVAQRGVQARGHASGPILIHPGSGGERKCWPAGKFIALAQLLAKRGRPVRFLLGETELDRWPAGLIAQFESAAPVARPATCLDLYRELCSASAYIGNDSGPSHLAGMLALPTLCLFGPSQAEVWRPLGPRVTVLRRQPLDELEVEEVAGAAMSMLA